MRSLCMTSENYYGTKRKNQKIKLKFGHWLQSGASLNFVFLQIHMSFIISADDAPMLMWSHHAQHLTIFTPYCPQNKTALSKKNLSYTTDGVFGLNYWGKLNVCSSAAVEIPFFSGWQS